MNTENTEPTGDLTAEQLDRMTPAEIVKIVRSSGQGGVSRKRNTSGSSRGATGYKTHSAVSATEPDPQAG